MSGVKVGVAVPGGETAVPEVEVGMAVPPLPVDEVSIVVPGVGVSAVVPAADGDVAVTVVGVGVVVSAGEDVAVPGMDGDVAALRAVVVAQAVG